MIVLGSNRGGEYRIQILVGGYIKVEDEGEDLTDKKVGCGGMRRGIWLGGWQTINQGRLGISGVLGQTQPLLTGHALHHIRIDPSGPASTSTSQNIIQCPLF